MKAKYAIMVMVLLLTVLVVTAGYQPASAKIGDSHSQLPWKIEYINKTNHIGAISMNFTASPAVTYYNNDTGYINFAYLYKEGQGHDCADPDWNCFADNTSKPWGFYDRSHILFTAPDYYLSEMVYHNPGNNQLYYRQYISGIGWLNTKILDFDNYLGGTITSSPSLAYDTNRNPHVAVVVDTGSEDYLIYAHYVGGAGGTCTGFGGSGEWDCEEIVAAAGEVTDPSIALDPDGYVSIAYYDPVNTRLRYAYPEASGANCGSHNNWTCITIEETGDVGKFPSLAYGDTFQIAYYNSSAGTLRYAKFVESGGNCVKETIFGQDVYLWQCDTIDLIGIGRAQVGLSLAMDGAEPLIAYQAAGEIQTTVKLAQTAVRSGITNGNCGPTGPYYLWQCDVIDQSLYGLGREIDLAVNYRGLAYIVYLEEDEYYMQNHLLVARQYFPPVAFLPLVKK